MHLHDHEAGNSCSCMEENKNGDIKTIFSYKATSEDTVDMVMQNETRLSSTTSQPPNNQRVQDSLRSCAQSSSLYATANEEEEEEDEQPMEGVCSVDQLHGSSANDASMKSHRHQRGTSLILDSHRGQNGATNSHGGVDSVDDECVDVRELSDSSKFGHPSGRSKVVPPQSSSITMPGALFSKAVPYRQHHPQNS